MGRRRDVRRGVEHLLRVLGEDVDVIVSSLEAQRVRGTPKDPADCALARYLNAAIGGDPAVSLVRVWKYSVHVHLTSRYRRPLVVPLSDGLVQFIVAFDSDCLPRLVAHYDDRGPGRECESWQIGAAAVVPCARAGRQVALALDRVSTVLSTDPR